jgi:hypothetical protein
VSNAIPSAATTPPRRSAADRETTAFRVPDGEWQAKRDAEQKHQHRGRRAGRLHDGERREHQRVALPDPASRLISSFDPSMLIPRWSSVDGQERGRVGMPQTPRPR